VSPRQNARAAVDVGRQPVGKIRGRDLEVVANVLSVNARRTLDGLLWLFRRPPTLTGFTHDGDGNRYRYPGFGWCRTINLAPRVPEGRHGSRPIRRSAVRIGHDERMSEQDLLPGSRWVSVVGDTEVLVMKTPVRPEAHTLECGGRPMVPTGRTQGGGRLDRSAFATTTDLSSPGRRAVWLR
jgi:hypothetical protein